MMVCLDTTFLIDVVRGKDEVVKFEKELERKADIVAIATPSVMELFKGIYLKNNLPNIKQDEIEKIRDILTSFTILDFDNECAILAGEIEADLSNRGEVIDIEDIMIAAIAKHNGEKLLTRNMQHFKRIRGLEVEGY